MKNAHILLIVFGKFLSKISDIVSNSFSLSKYRLKNRNLISNTLSLVNDDFDSHSTLFLAANWYHIENIDINHSWQIKS